MRILKVSLAALIVLATSVAAQASTIVEFSSTGVFTTSGTNVYAPLNSDVVITFDGVTDVGATLGAPFSNTSQVDFGFLSSTGTIATTPVAVVDTFTLNIFQTLPSLGTTSYVGSMTGSLAIGGSTAYIQFDSPFVYTLGGVEYELIEADGGVQGRASIVHPKGGALSSIQGQITLVPESGSTAALLGLGLLLIVSITRKLS